MSRIAAIETIYKGYRFRSRLEARWAVVFDACNIKWEYEPQGFRLPSGPYLPDFYLPETEVYIEIKPTHEDAQLALRKRREFLEVVEKPLCVIIETPNTEKAPSQFAECAICGRIVFGHNLPPCECLPAGVVYGERYRNKLTYRDIDEEPGFLWGLDTPRLKHALEQGQRARFEHGETGHRTPFTLLKPRRTHHDVYVAGSITDDKEDDEDRWRNFAKWRETFPISSEQSANVHGNTFTYGGPTIYDNHGHVDRSVASTCIREVFDTNVVFVWIERPDTIGTVAEVGAAYAYDTPIFAAFANAELEKQYYFVRDLATISIISPDALKAWAVFTRWISTREGEDQ